MDIAGKGEEQGAKGGAVAAAIPAIVAAPAGLAASFLRGARLPEFARLGRLAPIRAK
ncbi:hypothetical protein [Paraburkholderia tropica]|uniref:hypothetical protein n=1 Tax=Paraburkholderia tropica TaxID=92647 RepID=UPI000A8E1F74|nr:hypothetical protein [Paraburkholderia tropica]MBB2979088.1 hypothetical protein [Paraburkholderia tropica]